MKRKILSLVLVFMMMFTALPALTVSADLGTGTAGSITITAPSNLILDGQTFTLYKLFDLDPGYNKTANEDYVYTLTTPFEEFEASYDLGSFTTLGEYIASFTTGEGYTQGLIDLTADLRDFIIDKETNLTDGGPDYFKVLHVCAEFTVTGSNQTSFEIEDIPLGYYLVMGSGVNKASIPNNGDIPNPVENEVIAICNLTTTDPSASIALKADAPDVDKDVWDAKKGTAGDWSAWTDVNIGDEVTFRLTSKVPNMKGYDYYNFTIYDKLSGGLTYNDNLIVKVNNVVKNEAVFEDGEIVSGDYVVWYSLDDNNYTMNLNSLTGYVPDKPLFIAIDFINFKQYTTGYNVEITYKAILNEKAIITRYIYDEDGEVIRTEGGLGNPNDVWLEYSNNPYDIGDGDRDHTKHPRERDRDRDRGRTPWKRVRVFTFEIPIIKTDAAGNPLAGAKFQLYKATNPAENFGWNSSTNTPTNGTLIKFNKISDTNRYIHSLTGTDNEFITVDNDIVTLEGLEAGTYYLVETGAPDSYVKLNNPIVVVISYTTNYAPAPSGLGKLIDFTALHEYFQDGTKVNIFEIENKGGGLFPETGGIGRTIIYIVGSVMTFGAGVAFIIYMQVSSKKKTAKTAN